MQKSVTAGVASVDTHHLQHPILGRGGVPCRLQNRRLQRSVQEHLDRLDEQLHPGPRQNRGNHERHQRVHEWHPQRVQAHPHDDARARHGIGPRVPGIGEETGGILTPPHPGLIPRQQSGDRGHHSHRRHRHSRIADLLMAAEQVRDGLARQRIGAVEDQHADRDRDEVLDLVQPVGKARTASL